MKYNKKVRKYTEHTIMDKINEEINYLILAILILFVVWGLADLIGFWAFVFGK